MTLTVYVVRPPFIDELDVVHAYERVYRAVPMATELWKLLGDEARAKELTAVTSAAFDHDPARLESPNLERMLSLLEPLRASVVGTLTDADNKLSPARVVELRASARTLDLDESRGPDAQWAVAEALHDIDNLVEILRHALAEGHCLVFN